MADVRRQLRRLRLHWADAAAVLDRVGQQKLAPLAQMTADWSFGSEQLAVALMLACWWRVIEPLVHGPPPARNWRVLRKQELTAFVDAGIARERILLTRLASDHKAPRPSAGVLYRALATLRKTQRARPVVPADPRELYRADPRELYRIEKRKRNRSSSSTMPLHGLVVLGG